MFDFVRQHKRIMQLLLVILIFPSFVLFGIDGYKRFSSDSEVLATVDGVDILQSEVDRMAQSEAKRAVAMNPSIDVKIFDSSIFRSQILDQLVNQRLLQAAALNFKLGISDFKLASAISNAPEFQAIKGNDGQLNRDAYVAFLNSQGLTPQMYEASLKAGLMSESLIQSISASNLAESISNAQSAWSQSREVAWTRIDPSQLAINLKPSTEELKKFHEFNRDSFVSKESIEGEWIVLNLAQIASGLELKPDEVRSYFDQNIQNYAVPEQRRARHVLISLIQGAPASVKDAARQKIESVRSKLLANPNAFEAVAKAESQDTGSARQGGDLGFFAYKDMVKPFADAVFSLKKGEISQIIETEFGFHVIQLTDVKLGQTQAYESVRPDIEKQLKNQLAQKRFAELAEQFSNLVYEQPDGLASIAKQLGLEVKRFPATTRDRLADVSTELSHPKVVEALFSQDSLMQKRNTSAIDVGSSSLVSARVVQHFPQRQLEFDEALSFVADRFKATEALKRARAQAENLSKNANEPLSQTALISRLNTSKLSAKFVDTVMKQPSGELPTRLIIDEGGSGLFVVEVRGVKEYSDQTAHKMSKLIMQRSYADAQTQAYLLSLRHQLKVKLKNGEDQSKSNAQTR